MKYIIYLLLPFVTGCVHLNGQENVEKHEITIIDDSEIINDEYYKLGTNTSPKEGKFEINNYYITKNGKPVIMVMGEFQYSRYPREDWEEGILKMKASGIDAIGFYALWLLHEQNEGEISFDKNLDIRHFIELCAKHDLLAFPRIGPWAHGEARNGGYPEWFVKKMKEAGLSSSRYNRIDEFSTEHYSNWYKALSDQFKDLYYKDGGPIFAIQVDNEVWSGGPGSEGYEFLSGLRKLAESFNIDVPFYTATGWPGKELPDTELLPLWGGYPAAPWTGHANKLSPIDNYLFISTRLDKKIGSDMDFYEKEQSNKRPIYRHPYLTVEMGAGNQMTYHRRPLLKAADMISLIYTRLGVGANTIGYYIYHGVQHPLSNGNEYPTQESKNQIYPYANDYPMISYDFLAPISEWGFARPYYNDFKLTHLFIENFGENLAPMYPTLPNDAPKNPANNTALRYSVRNKDGAGYIFFNNYVRQLDLRDHKNVQFSININDKDTIELPKKGIDINNGSYGIIPFNMNIEGITLAYATAHPFSILDNKEKTYFFYEMEGVTPEFKFKNEHIKEIITKGKLTHENGAQIVTNLKSGKDCSIEIIKKNNERIKIIILSKNEALQAYEFKINGEEVLFLNQEFSMLDSNKGALTLRSLGDNLINFWSYPELPNTKFKIGSDGIFTAYEITLQNWETPKISFTPTFNDSLKNKWINLKTPTELPYSHKLEKEKLFASYKVNLPKKLPQGVNDVLLNFDYKGNTAQLYADDIIIADNFYNGTPMPFGLKRHQSKLQKGEFIFQISPLTSTDNIYFEENTDLNFVKTDGAILKNITLIPEYEFILDLKDTAKN
ncbi:beta-galactosidase [Maribacter ulvicola]|uniref:Beta-galactosidase, domain 2 n=1 Tax=Maribacter ulvicola TaxID=228959 RepID=A0A1N6QXM5_9FLAO|nr:beta-galactosidase [Maribacter ulvicola]SIQ21318.1 Beta-galactosidase, domain 2 [Maribacter ulvicola]